ncbi:radical SAM protein [Anaerostipes sp. MSJ-23]|uniref:radical SAM protein n=1 Tax=Anaerostipes sp. MSJ-23 TaxID=2841520 RepID=UPI001C115842|nr:radical SAM protein [Anaerostipes sp. MSJ-23]
MKDDVFIEQVLNSYRDHKQYLFSATSLHIFVLTNACNMCCVYCQAQDSAKEKKGKMDRETAKKAVDIALQSPNQYLTFEFQGGEPLLNFEIIKFIVEYSQEKKNDKVITYSLVTNTLLLQEEMLDFFEKYPISVSTSLDGDQKIYDGNRPQITGEGTFRFVSSNIRKMKQRGIRTNAVETTTKRSLKPPEKIINTYRDPMFCLGNVNMGIYDRLMENRVCKVTCQASVLEGLPGCCDCVYQPYCGVCPVIFYASNQSIYDREVHSYQCKVYQGMLDVLFEFLCNDPDAKSIFEMWI